jgi:hypothetical protein
MESGMETPEFAPMAVGLEYCVRVTWANGAEARVNHFAAEQDAQRWINRESRNWLRNRAQTSARRPASSDRNLIAFRGARIRTLQSA